MREVIANHVFWHFSEASFALIVVAAISTIAAWQGRRGRRVERKIDDAASNVDTGNGKGLGETVHDMAQTQEVILAQLHTNTREVVEHATKLDAHIAESQEFHASIIDKLDALTREEDA